MGHPSITVSALSRDTYSREGFLGFAFPFVEDFFLVLPLFLLIDQGPLLRISQWNGVPLTIYSVSRLAIRIRCSDSLTTQGGKVLQSAQR
jgi:hypothetical protein